MYIIYFSITLVLWKCNRRQTTLGFALNAHYHGLDGTKKIKIRLSPQIAACILIWLVEFKSREIVFLCLGVLSLCKGIKAKDFVVVLLSSMHIL